MSAGYDKLKAAVDKDCVKDGGTMHPELNLTHIYTR